MEDEYNFMTVQYYPQNKIGIHRHQWNSHSLLPASFMQAINKSIYVTCKTRNPAVREVPERFQADREVPEKFQADREVPKIFQADRKVPNRF